MNKKNALVTYYQDKHKGFIDIALKRFKNYAQKCDADLLEFKLPEESENPFIDKFIHMGSKIPKKYQKTLVLDVDILIRKDSPNLFELVPSDSVGMYNEIAMFQCEDSFMSEPLTDRMQIIRILEETCKLEPVEISEVYAFRNGFHYYNSGVILHNKKSLAYHQQFTEEQYQLMKENAKRCGEQVAINYLIRKNQQKIYHLPVAFNQMPYNRYTDYLNTSYFSHYANMSNELRAEQMQKDHETWLSWKL
jgi:hypothetical protein